MYSKRNLLMFILSIGAAVFLVTACGGGEEQAATDSEQGKEAEPVDEETEAAFQEALAEFQATDDMDKKFAIIDEFASNYADSDYGVQAIGFAAQTYYADHKEDAAMGVEYAKEKMALIADPDRQRDVKMIMLTLHGKTGDVEALEAAIADISAAELSMNQHMTIANAAADAGLPKVAVEHANAYLEMQNPETIREANAGRELTDEQVERIMTRGRANGYTALANAQLASDNVEAALETFNEAAEYTNFNFIGVPMSDLNVNWAKALMAKGDYEAALERVAPDAIMQGNKKAKEVFKEAYIANGGNEANLEEAMAEWRNRLAKEVPNFTAYSYDEEGTPVSYDSLKGEVTLLAFFFPT